ncbi:hypothetical protein GCM10023185_15370 [Hymenobacter saemangeumensis]|uniref:DUF2339 domain-containing protein n=2 Tax=Hymenobacter saemangeumensis TaxID=1084522 RepID=A0ABP8I9U8_9BACT
MESALPPAPPAPPRRPPPPPEPAGPTWWERASTLILENWTGILGAVVLVTGVGFLGIYAALRVTPPFRFLLICAFAAGLLGVRIALREKAFARQLNSWLLSSAAAIFLFACVAAVSIEGLRWATPPWDYLLLLTGVAANLLLAWRASREEVATLHGVLSLVALAVLPPTALTLGTAAGVTAFSIVITYRQRWKYQLLLSIASFFAFHLYWHQQLTGTSNALRLTAMGLVLLVGVAAAVVQYRSVYAQRRFEPLLFTAHLLNWTCLGINLYMYSTGSIWKTIPLGLGALLTFWAGRQARQLGIGWLFQTDTIISLILALATALSLQGWHATNTVILLFMLLEALLVALIMARQSEVLVYRVALTGAWLAGAGLLLLAAAKAGSSLPHALYRDAFVLALAGWAGLAFAQLLYKQPLLLPGNTSPNASLAAGTHAGPSRNLLAGFAGLAGLLQAGAGLLLTRVVFGWSDVPTALLLAALLALAGCAFALAAWVRAAPHTPGWVRQQQLVLAQFLVMLAVLGLHELGLSWALTLGILYAESMVAALLAARKQELFIYRFTLGCAFFAGTSLLLTAVSKVGPGLPPKLYRDALILALAGWAGMLFIKQAHRQLLPAPRAEGLDTAQADRDLLGGIAGLAGLLQAGTGLLLARLLFGWQGAPVALLLAALLGMGGMALGLAAWLHAPGLLPRWVRRQQLVLGQAFAVLAVFGLHEAGLSWPGVLLVLYAESMLAALLLSSRDEDNLLHLQTYLLVVLGGLLPLLVRYTSPGALGAEARAGVLGGAALLTVGYQLRRLLLSKAEAEYAVLALGSLRLPALGLVVGWLLLNGGALVYDRPWAAWAMMSLLGSLLYLRYKVAAPGVWAGLLLAAVGYLGLQWSYALWPPAGQLGSAGAVLLYLLPTLAVPLVGAGVSWWPQGQRFVRWPWVYLLGLHLMVALVAAVPTGHTAYLSLGFTGLAGAAFAGALLWRRTLPDEPAVQRAGQPDRYLLHLSYGMLAAGLLTHLRLLALDERFFGQPAEYVTAALLFAALAAMALATPPTAAPVYKSWHLLHAWLPEAALLFGTATLGHHIRTPWLPLLWGAAALALTFLAPGLPTRFLRLAVYGRLYYGLAAATASLASLLYIKPGQLLSPEWWEITAAVLLLFVYVALALQVGSAPYAGLSSAWDRVARPPRRVLETWLLYPAFLALTVLLVQSFDRSVLTVLLMLEVVAIFSTSLMLRRQDLRYLALAGMLGSLLRLVFFDLSRSGTITRAIVFILMGLLLLGMNALYARFKARFSPDEPMEEDLPPEGMPEPDVQPE